MLSTIGSIASQNTLPVWDKYNTIVSKTITWYSSPNEDHMYYKSDTLPWATGSLDYSFNNVSGMWENVGSIYNIKVYSYGTPIYQISEQGVITKLVRVDYTVDSIRFYVYYVYSTSPLYLRGTLVQSNIAAVEGTYPIDGRHTDGYWYVKKV